MSLAIVVGLLGEARARDEEAAQLIADDLQAVGRYFTALGLPAHQEPDDVPYFAECFGYGIIHHLRRDAVYLEETGMLPAPLDVYDSATADPRLRQRYERVTRLRLIDTRVGRISVGFIENRRPLMDRLLHRRAHGFDHLLNHSDAEDYYFPVEFDHVVVAVEPRPKGASARMFGSSQKLLAECTRLRVQLGIPDDVCESAKLCKQPSDSAAALNDWRSRTSAGICLALIEAATRSIATGGAIYFS